MKRDEVAAVLWVMSVAFAGFVSVLFARRRGVRK
jgi:hypothetical protein